MRVTGSHWRADWSAIGLVSADTESAAGQRLHNLRSCIDAVLRLSAERITVVIISNQPQATASDLLSNSERFPPDARIADSASRHLRRSATKRGRLVCCLGWRPSRRHRHPYYLTWAHKAVLARACRRGVFTHCVYLEDDIRFTDEAFSYWRATRPVLAPYGLIPGFVRVERVDGSAFVIDQRNPQRNDLPRLRIPLDEPRGGAAATFVNLEGPYQGMYVMDRVMAREHFRRSPARTPYRSRSVVHWGTRERAAIGPIFDHVPPGFGSRNVVPVQQETDATKPVLAPSCLIEHLTRNYSPRRIPVEDLFLA